ncbi:MAG: sulfatase atsG [Verrucomicrobiales bacterium]|nr:sulfatase atsG [Verrucomicrobiales bacterium]|tara:strand:- start:2803 stop:4212 length:1410 start_codon:yes stop_codon:yes gene_type:complete
MTRIALLVSILALALNTHAAKKPNFLFVIADDLTHRDIGCYGGQAHTPNINRLAKEGMRFTRCFQAAPMCSPTRHNIYTGLYPVKSGAYPNHTFAKDGTKSVVHYLKRLGYRVGLSGKTHISPKTVFPFEYSGQKNPDMEYIDKMFAECAKSETPFCLFACSNEPHTPWNKGDRFRYPDDKIKLPPYFVDTPETRDAMARYLAEITYYDSQVGRLLDLLKKHDLDDNTMVVVVSEQGSAFPFGKWTCYDTGLQSACIVRWPGKVKPGAVSDAMIEYVDMLPTFVDAAGGKPAKVLDGKSFVPVLTGKKTTHKEHVYGIMTTRGIINGSDTFGIRSVRNERFKYIRNFTPEIPFRNACTKSKEFISWIKKGETGDNDAKDKVNRYRHRAGEELYAVADDWYEWKNLADNPKYAKVKAELSAKLDEWMKSQGDKGQQTEIEAYEHQGRNRNKKKNQQSRNKGKKRKNQKQE